MKRKGGISWRRRYLAAVAVVIAGAIAVFVVNAFADAGNPVLNTIKATAVDHGNGTVTISVKGEWNWLTHDGDCNVNRSGTGIGVIWNDPTEPGWTVSEAASNSVNLLASPNGASESGSTVTLTGNGGNPWNGYLVGQGITVSGVGVAGYNGNFAVASVSGTHLTYTDSTTGLANSGGGTVVISAISAGIGVEALRAPFNPLSGASKSGSTVTLTSSVAGAFSSYAVGDAITVSGVTPSGYNGPFTILTVSGSTLTYNGGGGALSAGTGGAVQDNSKTTDTQNQIDRQIHPVDIGNIPADGHGPLPGVPGQSYFDPPPSTSTGLGNINQWLGGCGREPIGPTGTISGATDTSGKVVTLTVNSTSGMAVGDQITVAGVGVAGYNGNWTIIAPLTSTTVSYTSNTASMAASSGGTVNDTTATNADSSITDSNVTGAGCVEYCGNPWGSWGYTTPPAGSYTKAFTHTYVKTYVNAAGQTVSGLPSEICDNIYDMHGNNAGFDAPPDIQVDSDNDNSIQTNDFFSGNGGNCISLGTTTLTTNATSAAVGNSISDTATLTGVPSGAGGSVTFNAYSNSSCTGSPAFTSTVPVSGNGSTLSIPSGNFTPGSAGSYKWTASYSGDSLTLGSSSPCGATNETSAVVDANITITPQSAVNEIGTAHTFTVTFTAIPSGSTPVVFNSITPSVSGSPTTTTNTCGSPTVSGNLATCTITINNSTVGTFTIGATGSVTMGTSPNNITVTRTTGDTHAGDSPSATKTYVDANITICPSSTENEINNAHTFTVTFTAIPNGASPVSFGTITPSVSGTPTSTTNTCASPTSVSANVETCTITINNSTVGTFTLGATGTVTIGTSPASATLTRTTGDTHAGDSPSATKTFVDANITITPQSAVNEVGNAHTFTVTFTAIPNGASPVSFGTITPSVSGTPTSTTNTCNSPTSVSANVETCTITISNSTAGTFTIGASGTVTIGTSPASATLTRTTGDTHAGDSPSATKTFVDANITISPSASVNEINNAHTFTVTFTAIPSGASPVSFGTITPSVSGSPTSSSNTCAAPTVVSANVRTCTITISNATVGTFTLGATGTVTIGTSPNNPTLTRTTGDTHVGDSPSATKSFVDANITITPSSSVNEINNAHTFTVTFTALPGTAGPVSFGTITPSVSGSPTSTTNTCNTPTSVSANVETCTITISNSTVGTFTLGATGTVTIGTSPASATLTRTTGDTHAGDSPSATKSFVDANITITPSSSVNEINNAHTFTVTFTALPGTAGPVSFGTITPSVSGSPTSTTNTCNTPTSVSANVETCTITISNATVGTFTLGATGTVTIGTSPASATLTRTTGDTHAGDSPSATKSFVDANITITPSSSVNEIGNAHTFTVTFTAIPGTAGPVSFGTITPSVSGSPTSTTNTCNTPTSVSANVETCTITISNATVGTFTLGATGTVTIGTSPASATLTRTTGDTHAGDSPSATKSFVDANITITPQSAVNEVGNAHTFTVTFTAIPGTAGPVSFSSITPSVSGSPTSTSNTCASPTSVSANVETCTITISNATAGTFTIGATGVVTIGTSPATATLTRVTGDTHAGDSPSATKTFVDANITITPSSSVNEIGNAHTFTVTFTAIPNGASPVTFGTITPSVSGSPTSTTNTCNSPTSVSANVETCTITINNSSVGTFTIGATGTVTIGTAPNNPTLTRTTGDTHAGDSASATKSFVDANITITPAASVNEIGNAHTFTVTFTAIPGTAGPVSFTSITPSVSPTPTSTSNTCAAPTSVSANVETCTITINSTSVGTFTLGATGVVTIGTSPASATLTRSTGDTHAGDSPSATKTYVDANITISPLAATNAVGVAHTFTVTVTAIPSGASPVSFDSITPSVSPTPSSTSSTCNSPSVSGNVATCTITINSTTANVFTIGATAKVTMGGTQVTRATGDSHAGDSPSATKTYLAPSIGITKNPKSQTIASGSTATFTIVVTNTGGDTLLNVNVTDPLSPDCAKTSSSAGLSGLASMAPGASLTYTCTLANVTASFTNIATATGTPSLGGANVTATDSAPVTVTPPGGGSSSNPAISITKNPKSQTIASGGTANFTIVVTNTGNVTLTNVTVTDPLSPNCNASSSTVAALGSMGAGASVTYNCSLANVTASFTNVATVVGTAPSGATVTATDTAPVTVTVPIPPPTPQVVVSHPAIDIVKDPKSQSIAEGGTAHFKITVTNTGDVTLSNVTVTDPLSTDCNHSLGTLTVGQSKSYTCTKQNVSANCQNVATATGNPPTGSAVKATDHANIQVAPFKPAPAQHPKIKIVKSPKSQTLTTQITTSKTASGANKTTVHYGTANFSIKVTNTGDVTLHNVKVGDPLSPGCSKNLGTMAAGQSKTYTCDRSTVSSNFTNVATATGTSPKGVKVHSTDHANVTVKVKTTSTSGAQFTG